MYFLLKLFRCCSRYCWASPVAQMVGNPPTMQEARLPFVLGEDALEKGMATHSSIFAWRIPWTEEPVGLQSRGRQESEREQETSETVSSGAFHPLVPLFPQLFNGDCHSAFLTELLRGLNK